MVRETSTLSDGNQRFEQLHVRTPPRCFQGGVDNAISRETECPPVGSTAHDRAGCPTELYTLGLQQGAEVSRPGWPTGVEPVRLKVHLSSHRRYSLSFSGSQTSCGAHLTSGEVSGTSYHDWNDEVCMIWWSCILGSMIMN